MHYVCWVSSWSPARCRQAKPRCRHQYQVDRQWLTASCDMGRAGCGQAAVCASGCGGEREWHLARGSSVAEAPGECHGDGRERYQPLHPSMPSQSLQNQPCPPIDAVGAKRYIFRSAAAQPCMLATLAGFSGAQPVLCAVRGRSRSAWRARTGEHGRSSTASHAKVTVS